MRSWSWYGLRSTGRRTPPQMVIVIGGMKCGTSSLHWYLDLHPEIEMSGLKELNFFTHAERFRLGPRWYFAHFRSRAGYWGESSPNYTKYPHFPQAPERMHALLPQARLIYILRDPVARVLSHYKHNLSQGREQRSLADALAKPAQNPYVLPSCYHLQLERYLARYPLEQLLVLTQEELLADRAQALRRVFSFLGVQEDFCHPGFERVHHNSSHKQRPTRVARLIRDLPGGRLVRVALSRHLERPMPQVEMSDEVRRSLEAVLRPDVDKLRALLGRDFSEWSL